MYPLYRNCIPLPSWRATLQRDNERLIHRIKYLTPIGTSTRDRSESSIHRGACQQTLHGGVRWKINNFREQATPLARLLRDGSIYLIYSIDRVVAAANGRDLRKSQVLSWTTSSLDARIFWSFTWQYTSVEAFFVRDEWSCWPRGVGDDTMTQYRASVKSIYNFRNLLQRQVKRQISENYYKMRRIYPSFFFV